MEGKKTNKQNKQIAVEKGENTGGITSARKSRNLELENLSCVCEATWLSLLFICNPKHVRNNKIATDFSLVSVVVKKEKKKKKQSSGCPVFCPPVQTAASQRSCRVCQVAASVRLRSAARIHPLPRAASTTMRG